MEYKTLEPLENFLTTVSAGYLISLINTNVSKTLIVKSWENLYMGTLVGFLSLNGKF